ncbi:MAG: RHS repeat-associated core domain-containing protein [Desulfosalsimonadaceae bacterium]
MSKDGNPIWVKYDSSGKIVKEIGEAKEDLAEDKVKVMSAEAYCIQKGIPSLDPGIRTVLVRLEPLSIIETHDWNIAFKSGFYTKGKYLGQPSPPVVDGLYGYNYFGSKDEPPDKLWGPVSGAKVEAPGGWRTASLENGGFGISMNMPVSCLPYSQWLSLLVTLRFKNFDPEDSDHSGFYYLAWPTVFAGGGDVGACPNFLMTGPSLEGVTYGDAWGVQSAALANAGNPLNTVNIPIDVAMMTGTAVLKNEQRGDIGIDASVVGVIPVTGGETEYLVNTEDLMPVYADDPDTPDVDESDKPFPPPDNKDFALLKTITTDDLENTDTYIFRESNDMLIACIEGLGKDKKNWYYGGGSDGSSGARIHYKMMLRGPISYQITGRKDNIEKWQSSVQMDDELRGVVADHLKIGEYVKVILVNRATGYIGTQRVKFGYSENGSETLLNFTPEEVVMRPPNLSIRAERKYKVDMGLTKGKEYEHIIGFEGSGLTSDQYISVTTDWVDWDGAALPPDLPGYTGRLAKVVKENTLEEASPLIANFEIIPGLHKVLLKLPEGALDKAHYYIHVNGESIDDNPDFSTIGAAPDGPLQYRPKHYVPVKIPILNTEATEAARFQAYTDSPLDPVYTPIYHWVYRPEMEFTLLDLEMEESGKKDVDGEKVDEYTCIDDPKYQFQIPDLLYTLLQDELPELYKFGMERDLKYGLADEEVAAEINSPDAVSLDFKNSGHLITDLDWGKIQELDAMDILGIRLYQTSDRENVLWRYEFPFIHSIVLDNDKNFILPGESATASAHTYPVNREVTWSIMPTEKKESLFVHVNSVSGEITVDKESPKGFVVLRATDKEYPNIHREEIIFVECPDCGGDVCGENGKGIPDVGCVDMRFSIGLDTHGNPAGTIMLFSEKITPELSTPAKILFTSLSWDQLDEADGIRRVNAPDGTLRQILAPESFVNITNVSESGYTLSFYKRGAAGAKNADGQYTVQGSPDEVWQIAGSGNTLTVSNANANKTFAYTQPDADTVALTINNAKTIQRTVTQNGDDQIVTQTVKDASGNVGETTVKTLRKLPRGLAAVSSVTDPAGAALTTTYTYYDSPANPGENGRIKSEVNSDGSWNRFYYDADGWGIKTVRSWLDAPPDAPENQARVITYDYKPLPGDSGLRENIRQPRTVNEFIEGKPVSRTYYAYMTDAFGNRIEITEQCAHPSAAYNDSQNLRTSRIYYKDDLKSVTSGKIRQVTSPDYRQDTYDYEKGNYVPGKPGTFTPGSGTDVRETVIHGTAVSPDGIAHKTTKDITVTDTFGRSLMSASYVYTGTDYARVQWSVNILDNSGHVIKTETSTGTVTESVWGCCNRESTVDETGVQTSFFYDALNRLETQSRPGPSGVISTTYTYDAAGRRLTQVVSAGGLSQATSSAYDTAGRLKSSTDPSGLTTVYDYSADGRTTTVTRPGGATEVTERYMDGQVKRVYGTGTVERVYEYGVNADNTLWTKVYTGGQGSAMWEKTFTDVLGRVVKTEKPGFAGAVVTASNTYNNIGQLIKTQATGQADQVVEYDDLGNQIRSGLDVDGSGDLESVSADRITETDTRYAQIDDDWWQQNEQKIYAQENTDEAKSTGISRSRITGLGTAGLIAESVSIDMFGNQAVSKTILDRASHTETRTVDYPDSTIDAQSVSVAGFMMSSTGKTGVTMTYAYDAFGRQTGVTDPRTGTSITHYDAKGRVDYVEDAAGSRTAFAYDPITGRKTVETNALGKSTRYAYNLQGQVIRTWGDGAYPVEYEYDGLGRMIAMTTFRIGSDWDGVTWPTSATGDTTAWNYDDATGLLTSKTDAAGNAVTYTYDAAGHLSDRTWARTDSGNPIVTDYAYNPATGELTGIDYSDATPDIGFTYDRLGLQTHVTDAAGSRTFAYTGNLQPASETITGIINRTITRQYETSGVKGRNTGFSLNNYEISYGYDQTGRMDGVNWNVNSQTGTAAYTYAPNSDLLSTTSTNNNLTAAYAYEPNRNVKTSVQNTFGVQVISNYAYRYDTLGRRTSVANTGIAFSADAQNKYQYNDRNELTESSRFMGTDPDNITQPVEPEKRIYDYDPIGNRNTATEGSASKSYTANSLNQYDEITAGGETSTLTYDADGNLTIIPANAGIQVSGGQMALSYNAENRLTSVAPRNPANGDKKVEFIYDYMGRRVKKSVYAYNSDSWLLTSEFFFVYDGWNLVEEITEAGSTTTSRYFVWGQDLSQSLQGAGGIGGLIATVDGSASYLYCFDANGNIGQVVNAVDGVIAAQYEYDPYGKPIKADGAYAGENPFRFSTKYHDDETGLVYYGYRYYSAGLGRWTSKDPINELGHSRFYLKLLLPESLLEKQPYLFIKEKVNLYYTEVNPYGFVYNSLQHYDILGLAEYVVHWNARAFTSPFIGFGFVDIEGSVVSTKRHKDRFACCGYDAVDFKGRLWGVSVSPKFLIFSYTNHNVEIFSDRTASEPDVLRIKGDSYINGATFATGFGGISGGIIKFGSLYGTNTEVSNAKGIDLSFGDFGGEIYIIGPNWCAANPYLRNDSDE